MDFGVQETTLGNGLQVLTVEHHEAPVTTVWIWYRVGSRNERPGITGISHWVEHMLFKGGQEFPKGAISKEVSRVGGYDNGMTSNDFTVYFETVPAAHADLGLRIEADRLANAVVDPDEVAAERSVIISEREGAENHPQFLLHEELMLAAYHTHPYRWSVIGWKADLQAITREDLWQYYRQHYAPSNAVLIVAGDIERPAVLARVEELFGGIAGEATVAPIRSTEPSQEGERRLCLRRPGTASYLGIMYHGPAASHEDAAALRVLNSIMSGTGAMTWMASGAGGWRTSRLYKALVETELASSAWSSVIPQTRDPGPLNWGATVRVGVEPERVEEAMLRVIAEACAAPPGADELERAQTRLRASLAYAGESATGIASLLGQAEMADSHESIVTLQDRLMAVTAEDVLRVCQTYFGEDRRTVGWFLPTGEPDGGGAEPPPGTPPACVPQRFWATGLDRFREAARTTLDNGLRVVACRAAATPSVYVSGTIRGGAVFDAEAQAGRAGYTARMVQRGTHTRSHEAIFAPLDAVGATFGVGAGREAFGFSGNCLVENLPLLLETCADVLSNPAFPADELEKTRTEIITGLREDEDDTRVIAERAARRLAYPAGHPYGIWEPGSEATIKALGAADLAEYHRRYVRPDQAIVVVVGALEPEEAVRALQQHLGGWQAATEAEAWPDLSAGAPAERRQERVVMRNKTQCDIALAFPGVARTHPDYYALTFATQVLGQLGFMGRFGETVRDELGLAYYVYASMGAARGSALWQGRAGVNPRNVQLAVDTMLQLMRAMQQDLISDREYDDLITHELGALAMGLESKGRMAGRLLDMELWELGVDFLDRYPEIVRSTTKEDIRTAAQRYFQPERHVLVVAGPE